MRDLNRPLFGKTGTTSGPTNVWFVGGTPEVVAGVYIGYDQPRPMGHGAQGGRIAAPIFKQFAQAAFKDMPKVPFVAPPGIRMVRIDRASGKRVFGTFPTTEDPKSSVIWEAFKPESEPRRASRARSAIHDQAVEQISRQAQSQAAQPQAPQTAPQAQAAGLARLAAAAFRRHGTDSRAACPMLCQTRERASQHCAA